MTFKNKSEIIKGMLIGFLISIILFFIQLIISIIIDKSSVVYVLKSPEIWLIIIYVIVQGFIGALIGLDITYLIGKLKQWKKLNYTKKGVCIGLLIGTSILIISVAYMIIYTFTHVRSGNCPAFVETVSCLPKEIINYIMQTIIMIGFPAIVIFLILGVLFGFLYNLFYHKIKNKN